MAEKIIILQTAFVGDLLLSIPLLKRLKQLFPGCSIDLICRRGLGSFMQQLDLVQSVFEVDKSAGQRASLDAALFQNSYDLLLSPHRTARSAFIGKKIRAKKKIGYREWWNFWAWHERVSRPKVFPEALRQLFLLKSVDPEISDFFKLENGVEWLAPKATAQIPDWASMRCESSLVLSKWQEMFEKPVCFLAPGSVWNTKRWTVSGYAAVAEYYQERGMNVCLVGAPGEQQVTAEITAKISGLTDLCGKTSLFEMFQLFARGSVLICNDSGAMHMASVAGLPAVAVFGPTTLELGYRPWQDRAVIVEQELSCRPCGLHGSKQCPIGTHECMEGLSYRQVVAAVDRLI